MSFFEGFPRSGGLLGLVLALSLLSCKQGYEGSDTLANYPNPATLKSELAKDALLDLIGFWDENKDTQLVTAGQMVEITAFLVAGLHTSWVHDVDTRSMNVRPTGPFIDGSGYNTHQRVRVYYSNGVVDWLLNDRQGEIPDGAMIVKQMYPTDPDNTTYGGHKVTGWAVMIRDSKATSDGWLWYLFFFPGTPSYGQPVLLSQYGMSYCLACHSGADNDMATFAYIGNLNGDDPSHYTAISNPAPLNVPEPKPEVVAGHSSQTPSFGLLTDDIGKLLQLVEEHRDSHGPEMQARIDKHLGDIPKELAGLLDNYIQKSMSKPVSDPRAEPDPVVVATFGPRQVDGDSVVKLPWDLFSDHTAVTPDDLKTFVSSDNCRGCHDASLLLGGRQPAMMMYRDPDHPDTNGVDDTQKYNISIYGEWGTSMMGLAGRDPIFLAQLESEHALRPGLKDWTSNLCLSCHQVAGQRQFHLDGQAGAYTSDLTYAVPNGKHLRPRAVYGALGRDGVTCTVCHQVMAEGLGEPQTFTGKFKINPEPGSVFGPFPDDEIKPYYMEQALGISPKHGEQIKDAGLCGSCHTIELPVLPVGAGQPPRPGGPVSHEQTTYLEWLNSDYAGDPEKTCQGCHMPDNFREAGSLQTEIANVEDGAFPEVGNRAEADLITPEPKPYRRHTLVGLNIFANRMFQQFPTVLGVTTLDPGTPLTFGPSSTGAVHRLQLTEQEMELMAGSSVVLDAQLTGRDTQNLTVQVQLRNEAGHKFPSGVGFRRAFLEVTALAADGRVLWGSGRTNEAGVILDGNGQPLASEFTVDWRELQPDYTVIERQDQALVFETRHINDDGKLTTSFLGLAREMKDNRLLPLGWKTDGPYAGETRLVALGGEPDDSASPGTRRVEYRIPASVGAIDRVQVRLLYQSTPPYYLRDRFATAGQENDRLYYLVSRLNLDDSLARGWSVEIARTEVR